MYGCETLSLKLGEEHRLRVFENRVLRRIFGTERVEVMGGLRQLHSEELHKLYSPPSIILIIKSRRMRWTGHVARMKAKRNTYRILVGKSEEKRPLGRTRRRWVSSIKMDLRDIEWDVIVMCRRIRVTKRRALVRMIGFINSLVTHTLLIELKFTGNTASLIHKYSNSLLRTH
jgi:hypothetical protein